MNSSVTAVGELLVDFTPAGTSARGHALYEQNPGGAPANVAVSVVRQGGRASLLAAVGTDFFGEFLRGIIRRERVDDSGLQFVEEAATTLAFVSLDEHGDRSFSFCRKPGADMLLRRELLPLPLLQATGVLHFGSLSLCGPVSRDATYYAVEAARSGGALISYDPNWRPVLWPDADAGVARMKEGLARAQILKLSEEELLLLSGSSSPEEGTRRLAQDCPGLRLQVVTLGPRGCFYRCGGQTGRLPAYDVEVVDTTGAGDAFWGCLLAAVAENRGLLSPGDPSPLERALDRANAAGSLCAAGRGAIDSIPGTREIDALTVSGRHLIF